MRFCIHMLTYHWPSHANITYYILSPIKKKQDTRPPCNQDNRVSFHSTTYGEVVEGVIGVMEDSQKSD